MYYKHLLFDLDHTLLDFSRGEEVALTQFLASMEVEDVQAFKEVYRPLNQGMWKDLEKGLITKKELINTQELVLDFAGLEYISSAGLRVILKMQKFMNVKGTMKLIHVSDIIQDVFDITGFADILSIE